MRAGVCREGNLRSNVQCIWRFHLGGFGRAEQYYVRHEQASTAEPPACRPDDIARRYCQRALAHHDRGHRCRRCAADRAARAADPGRGPHHPDEPAADDVPGRARPDHRGDGAADHRPAIQRRQQSFLGDHGLSAGVDRGSARVRHAERHLRPPRHDHGFACPVHSGLDPVRGGTQHDGADSGARPAGPWRRRHHAGRADRDLRRGLTARARQVSGLFQRRLDGGGIAGTGAWRRVRRTSALVDDLLDQRAACARRAGAAAAEDGQDPGVPPPAQGRLARRRAADGVGRRVSCWC